MPKMEQMKTVGISMRAVPMPSEIRVNLDKYPMPQNHLKIGARMKIAVEGKVTRLSMSPNYKECTLEIMKMDHMGMNGNKEKEDLS